MPDSDQQARTTEVLGRIHVILGKWLRGQLLLIALVAGVAYIGLGPVLHLPYALALAVLTGFLEVIPLIGPLIATAIVAVDAFAKGGPGLVAAVVVLDDDWEHALGGIHVVADAAGAIVAHAAVIERELRIAGRPVRTGYVEAVATSPDRQGTGLGTLVMTEIGDVIRGRYELGALGTGSHHFYERLGWRTWVGPASVRAPEGERRTPDEEGFILVLETPASPPLDLAAPISCDWRPGDVW
jgi:aminoglycoside 2'-N-acetyltransferase I